MIALVLAVIAVIAYFFGSMNTLIINSRLFFHTDLRKFSSDNVGLSRFEKRFGRKGYIYLLVTEALKDIIPILIGGWLMLIFDHQDIGKAFALFCIVLGTNFPIMYGFRGEHSLYAVGFGLFILSKELAFLTIAVFAAAYFISRYVSLSALIATAAMCVLSVISIDDDLVRRLLFFTAIIIFIEYRKNIVNLLKGREPKFRYRKDVTVLFD